MPSNDGSVVVTCRSARWADVAAPLAYLGLTFVLLNLVWDDPNGRMIADKVQDQSQFEWILARAARSLTLWGANSRSGL
jgi:hypothetical protein